MSGQQAKPKKRGLYASLFDKLNTTGGEDLDDQ